MTFCIALRLVRVFMNILLVSCLQYCLLFSWLETKILKHKNFIYLEFMKKALKFKNQCFKKNFNNFFGIICTPSKTESNSKTISYSGFNRFRSQSFDPKPLHTSPSVTTYRKDFKKTKSFQYKIFVKETLNPFCDVIYR